MAYTIQKMALLNLPNLGPMQCLLCWWLHLGTLNWFSVILIVSWFQTGTWAYWVRILSEKYFSDSMEYDCRAPQGDGVLALGEEAVSQTIVIVMNGEKVSSPASLFVQTVHLLRQLPWSRIPYLSSSFPAWMQGKILWLISFGKLCLIFSSPEVVASSSDLLCHALVPSPRN